MLTSPLTAAALVTLTSAPVAAEGCRDTNGKFIECSETSSAKAKCKDTTPQTLDALMVSRD